MPKAPVPAFDADIIREVADILGETAEELTGSQIDQALAQARIPNVSPGITKRHRIHP